MNNQDLLTLWMPAVTGLPDKLRLIPDDAPLLDTPSWSGTFDKGGEAVAEQAQTPRELLVHLVVASYEVPLAFIQGDFSAVGAAAQPLQGQPPSVLADALEQRIAKLQELLASLSDKELAAPRQTPFHQGDLGGMLALGVLHLQHHKGQLALEMRRMGLRPGRFLG